MGNDIVVAARALSKHAGSRPILRQVDCEVRRGQVVGLLGKNGAGKSTLLDLLLGFALPSDGGARCSASPARGCRPPPRRASASCRRWTS